MGMFILENKKLQEDYIAAFQYLNGAYSKNGERLLVGPVVTEQSIMVSD